MTTPFIWHAEKKLLFIHTIAQSWQPAVKVSEKVVSTRNSPKNVENRSHDATGEA